MYLHISSTESPIVLSCDEMTVYFCLIFHDVLPFTDFTFVTEITLWKESSFLYQFVKDRVNP